MNAVIAAVGIMLVLSLSRVHVVIALIVGALVGGLTGGLGIDATLKAFNSGLGGGATVALSYALLGAFRRGDCQVRPGPCAGRQGAGDGRPPARQRRWPGQVAADRPAVGGGHRLAEHSADPYRVYSVAGAAAAYMC